MPLPSQETLRETLKAAWNAHHEFETVYLNGIHDTIWAGWYAAFVLGRLGDFTTPSRLARLLEEVTVKEHWTSAAAAHVLQALENE